MTESLSAPFLSAPSQRNNRGNVPERGGKRERKREEERERERGREAQGVRATEKERKNGMGDRQTEKKREGRESLRYT